MEQYITAKELAHICGITVRRVNQLTSEESVFKREADGKYDLVKNVAEFYRHKYQATEETSFREEQALHERAKREKTELQIAVMKNELHSAKDVEHVVGGMLVVFRNRILGIPAKIAPRLRNKNKTSVIRDLLDAELRDALTELSAYDPALFAKGGAGGDAAEDN